MADPNLLRARLKPLLEDMVKRSTVAERFVHRDAYRITLATRWTNLVLKPEDAGIRDVVAFAVQALREDGDPIPEPLSTRRGERDLLSVRKA